MHEYSIVQSLLEQCDNHAKEQGCERVLKVVIKVGKLSGVEPHLLQSAFDAFKREGVCHDAELEMNLQDLVLYCEACHKECEQEEIRYQCTHCQGTQVKVLDGEEMYLMSLEMDS